MKQVIGFIGIFVYISSLISCESASSSLPDFKETPIMDSIVKIALPEPPKPITYSAIPMKGNDSLYQAITTTYTGDSMTIILHLNRIDKPYLRSIDTIIIPDSFVNDMMAYAPFPKQMDTLKKVNKLVIFSYPIQAYGVYNNGTLIKWGATSMGKQSTPTPKGLNFTNWKSKMATSTVNSSWKLPFNFNIMNHLGVGWHQYALPGHPASHSCLRLKMEDAEWLYEYADQWILKNGQLIAKGTPVIVYGEYPWKEKSKPWYALARDEKANYQSEDSLNEIINPFLEEILKAQVERKMVEDNNTQQVNDSSI